MDHLTGAARTGSGIASSTGQVGAWHVGESHSRQRWRAAQRWSRDDLGARAYDVFGTANFLNLIPWTAALEYVALRAGNIRL